jgi:glycosyltransferase involved in cell wall biosynthesis
VSVRVLVIDDASSDETEQVGREFASLDRRVDYRRHTVNIGHIRTYNEGLLEWSAADYLVLLSADDVLAPGSLARAVQIMNADQSVGMVYGRAVYFQHDTDIREIDPATWEGLHYTFPGSDWIARRCKRGQNVISSPEVVVRGAIQRAVGGYRENLPHTGDLEMWLRIAARSNIAYVRGLPQAFYRIHSESMLRTKYRRYLVDLCHRKAAFDDFFENNRDFDKEGRLQHLANRSLAREALWSACRAYDHDEVQEVGAAELVQFALKTYAPAQSLSEYAALRRRQRLGPVICNRTQIFIGSAVARRMRNLIYQRRIRLCGA